VRNNHGWEPDGEILADPAVIDSCKILAGEGLALDLHFRDQTELSLALRIADALPELTIIIDHLGKPLVKDTALFGEWKYSIDELAKRQNIYLKYSGWSTFLGQARADDIRGHVDHAFRAFSADRIMFGSNWPVALVASDYRKTFQATLDALPALSSDELNSFLNGTAVKCYRLVAV
jgi:L-fuconolactonase